MKLDSSSDNQLYFTGTGLKIRKGGCSELYLHHEPHTGNLRAWDIQTPFLAHVVLFAHYLIILKFYSDKPVWKLWNDAFQNYFGQPYWNTYHEWIMQTYDIKLVLGD